MTAYSKTLAMMWVAAPMFLDLAIAADAPPPAAMIPAAYAAPGTPIDVGDGRKLNLRCSGTGAPVVVLEAGGNADASTWFRVHDALARKTRVCAYDRAGFGFSAEGPLPRDLEAQITDLHALIREAKLPVPVILVGHSLGSNIVRGYARRHPEHVSALVLVDPPEHGAEARMPEDWRTQVDAMVAQRNEFLDQCEAAATAGDDETLTQKCLRAPPPWMSKEVAMAMVANKSRPAYWRTLRSELASAATMYAIPVPADEHLGSLPLVLLSAESIDEDVPEPVRDATAAALRETRERILASSTRNTHVVVDSSHDIQLDRPEAIVSAVHTLLAQPRQQ